MSKSRSTARNIFWGLANKIVLILLPFVVRTVLIYRLGIEYAGITGLFTSILNILNITELGFGSAVAFAMYKPIAEHDDVKICALIGFLKNCYRAIGAIIALVGLCLIPALPVLVHGGYPSGVNITFVYVAMLSGIVLGYFMYGYKRTILIANMRDDVRSKANMIALASEYTLQIVLVWIFCDYYLYVLVIPVGALLENLIINWGANRLYPDYRSRGSLDAPARAALVRRVKGLVLQKLGSVVLTSADAVIVSAFLGLTILGQYQNYYYIFMACNSFMIVIVNAIIPAVGNSLIKDDEEANFEQFLTFNFLYNWVTTWIAICILCLIQPFMRLWMGAELMLPDYFALVFSVYFYCFKWCDMVFVYLEAGGLWWKAKLVPMIAAILNIVLSLVLVSVMGLVGVLVATIACVLLVYDVGNSKIVLSHLFPHCRPLRVFARQQGVHFACSVFVASVTYFCCTLLPVGGVMRAVLDLALLLVLPNAILVLFYAKTKNFKAAHDLIVRTISRKAGM
ncbi:lipopolysaccharide biosynthesis protein [Adlercreutzia murintestinalis]|uniref:lipopolysaccharide biosynthesis protein n=1 Tax=Adlercreutzia murintestinalis TaxID=2941325 RepID=UPI002041FCCC|nr:hypothetical protein [Adlercreutzia murintestinalis]